MKASLGAEVAAMEGRSGGAVSGRCPRCLATCAVDRPVELCEELAPDVSG